MSNESKKNDWVPSRGEEEAMSYVSSTLKTAHYNQQQRIEDRLTLLEKTVDQILQVMLKLADIASPESDKAKEPDDDIDDGMTDVEADSDALRCAGWGTDEDYGGDAERL